MWARSIEVVDPFGDRLTGVVEAEEQGFVQQLVSHATLKLSQNPFCMGLPGSM